MPMDTNLVIATALSGLSVLLLLVLLSVWIRNYRTFRSSLVLGLIAFGTVLLIENVVAFYFFFSMGMLYAGDPFAQQMLLVLRTLQVAAISFLTYTTLK